MSGLAAPEMWFCGALRQKMLNDALSQTAYASSKFACNLA